MPPPAPSETLPDLSEVLATFDFRPGGDARELAARVASEADALERGNAWALLHSHAEEPALDRAVARATEELGKVEDRYLRAYAEKLGGMGADVRAIERRNRREGTARDNMERLLKETQGLLARLRLPEGLVETLRTADLGDAAGREAAVRFARVLWARTGEDFGQLASMRAVRDRRTEWAGYVREFGVRIGRHVGGDCERALAAHSKAVAVGKGTPPRVPVARLAEALGGYRELLQWLREADPRAHYEVLGGYVEKVGAFYDKEVKRFAGDHSFKRSGAHPLPVFAPEQQTSAPTVTISSNIKQTSSAIKDFSATLTRKTVEGIKDSSGTFLATLKRGAKLDVRALEAANASAGATPRASMDADRMSVATKETRGREDGDIDEEGTTGDEAMEMVLTAVAPPLVQQQAFITELFELETKRDATLTKQQTQGSVNGDASNGISRSVSKKDIKWQKRVAETMDRFVPSLVPELVLILDTAVRRDPTSSLGVLVVVEKHQALVAAAALQGVPPSHWMLGVLNRTGDKAKEAFARFLDSQVAIIEETKGMNRKKIGIFDFVRTFPLFVDRMESLLALNPNAPQDPAPPSRQAIAGAYDRISRAMFDSLDAISREVEKAARQEEDEGRRYGSKAAGGGEEDTVIVHVLHIQNMHHLSSELRFRKIPSLEPCVKRAKGLYEYHLAAYTKVVVRRPLGKLLEFFDGVDEMVRNGAEREVAFRQAYSKGALRDLVKKYPGKEIRKSLEVLYKRVEKHFTEDDSTSSLMQVVWRNIQEDFIKRHALFEELIARCYPGSQIHLEFTVQDLLGYFSELARSH
ncbi:exocyst complex component Sec3-domain-containing protein [Hyaloraphidium curvatum]|nr:exocyst complex component Sec3-domain-containing protein [Hyaloraphidium curvatum]